VTSLPGVPVHLSETIVDDIYSIGLMRYPIEACGMLLPEPLNGSQVIELPNRSLDGQSAYVIWPDDVEVALGEWAHSVDRIARESVSVWHTHPSGLIGPSRLDMRRRIKGVSYLVVAMQQPPVPTWF